MIHNWGDIEICQNGYQWKGTIPIIKHRRKIFKEFMENNPLSQMDGAFCLRHYTLIPKRRREKLTGFKTIDDVPDVWRYECQCKGCWNCSSIDEEITDDTHMIESLLDKYTDEEGKNQYIVKWKRREMNSEKK